MDDFNVTSLHESKNEWGARLLTILTPLIVEGFQSIYEEAYSLCKENNETEKHLMTFQNFISRIPKWNPNIIDNELKRIVEKSGCSYLEELVTCVHIIQLKLLTAVRAGTKQKKIDVKIPKIEDFIHKTYIFSARKLYKNVYLFERHIPPLQVQKNHREMEIIIQECILNAVRESIPLDTLLRAYLDETTEEDVNVEVTEEEVKDMPVDEVAKEEIGAIDPALIASTQTQTQTQTTTEGEPMVLPTPKTLEEESLATFPVTHDAPALTMPPTQPLVSASVTGGASNDKISIGDDKYTLDHTDVHDLEPTKVNIIPDLLLDDIEVL